MGHRCMSSSVTGWDGEQPVWIIHCWESSHRVVNELLLGTGAQALVCIYGESFECVITQIWSGRGEERVVVYWLGGSVTITKGITCQWRTRCSRRDKTNLFPHTTKQIFSAAKQNTTSTPLREHTQPRFNNNFLDMYLFLPYNLAYILLTRAMFSKEEFRLSFLTHKRLDPVIEYIPLHI